MHKRRQHIKTSQVEIEIIAKGIGKQSREYQHQFVSQWCSHIWTLLPSPFINGRSELGI